MNRSTDYWTIKNDVLHRELREMAEFKIFPNEIRKSEEPPPTLTDLFQKERNKARQEYKGRNNPDSGSRQRNAP